MRNLAQEYNKDQKDLKMNNNDNNDINNNKSYNNYINLVVSKICHDLITPAGAIANGLELLDKNDIPNPDILNLLEQSAKTLTAKLIMFRAFMGSNAARMVANNDFLIRTIKPYLDIYNISIEDADIKDDINNFSIKAVTLTGLTIIAAEIIPFGGSVGIKFTQNGCYFLLKGRTVDRKQEVINFFSTHIKDADKNIEDNARNILLFALKDFALSNNIDIKVTELGKNELMFTF